MSTQLKFMVTAKQLHFKFKAGTSRGWYETRDCAYLLLIKTTSDGTRPAILGVGECAPLPLLSPELPLGKSFAAYLQDLRQIASAANIYLAHWLNADDSANAHIPQLNEIQSHLQGHSAARFALETALLQAKRHSWTLFDTPFGRGETSIAINGLIWMGDFELMRKRIINKLAQGFRCIKIKIGAIDFARELELLQLIREEFSSNELTLRVDANGAFSKKEALFKLEQLAKFDLHSIEQPIKAGQPTALARLCQNSPIAIALDEELIGIENNTARSALLDDIRPQYIVLKPTLHGGLAGTAQWLKMAAARGIGAWLTSALESSVGLNSIAHFIGQAGVTGYQGLGTGQLFTDNLPFSALQLNGQYMHYNPKSTPQPDLDNYFDDIK